MFWVVMVVVGVRAGGEEEAGALEVELVESELVAGVRSSDCDHNEPIPRRSWME